MVHSERVIWFAGEKMSEDFDTLQDWERVPLLVANLLPLAVRIQKEHVKTAEKLGLLSHTALTWLPTRNELHVYPAFEVPERTQDMYKVAMFDEFSPKTFFVSSRAEPNWACEILIKKGALFPAVGQAWDFANSALGGSRPLSNALVSGLALSGLGYGAGTLMEHLFPERYVERGRLRKTLATAGALGGLGLGAANAYANARATNSPYWKGWLIPNNAPVPLPGAPRQNGILSSPRTPQTMFADNNQVMPETKQARELESGLFAPSIPVDAFNRVVWNDVRPASNMNNPYGTKSPWGSNEQPMHTPPALASATTGLVSGIGAMTNSPIISPATVVSGLASAGVGLATAHLAGRALGALAGLTPEAQNKLQDMGLWAGMLHAVVPPVLNQLR